MTNLSISTQSWPIAGSFTISRGTKTQAKILLVTLESGGKIGRGECVPYARYDETLDSVAKEIEEARQAIADGATRDELQSIMTPGAARNALDCALWDLEAKLSGQPAWKMAGLSQPQKQITAYTLSLGTPQSMQDAAAKSSDRALLKIKLGGENDHERIAAVRRGAPNSKLIVDANEGWTPQNLQENLVACASEGVDLIEQPLPSNADEALADVDHSVPICADESAHTSENCADLANRYDVVNIKLDKTGGLTEALKMAKVGSAAGLDIMVGCMVSTSLSMAPAMLLAQNASFVDLDGPLILAKDREPGLRFHDSFIDPPTPALWG